MIPIMIESPYSAACGRAECIRYALWCCVDSERRGEAPMASHLFFTQFIPEDKDGRERGLACRDVWARAACAVVVRYVDLGTTLGMFRDVDCTARVETRMLPDDLRDRWQSGEWPQGSCRLRVPL